MGSLSSLDPEVGVSLLVSVIIPCYNVQEYIEECVQSVVKQTYPFIEIICIDNNSTDNTWSKLLDLKLAHRNVVIEREYNSGACAARNKGLFYARGEWIQFLDADDILMETKIEHQIELINSVQTENVAFVSASSFKRKLSGNEVVVECNLDQSMILSVFTNLAGNTCSNLWRNSKIREVNGWNEELKSSQEFDLMMRLVLRKNIFLIDTVPMTVIRERKAGQISQNTPTDNLIRYINLRLYYLKEIKISGFLDCEKDLGKFQDFLMVSVQSLGKIRLNEASKIFNENFKEHWVSKYTYGWSKLKLFFIKFFGFKFYMRILKSLV